MEEVGVGVRTSVNGFLRMRLFVTSRSFGQNSHSLLLNIGYTCNTIALTLDYRPTSLLRVSTLR